MGYLLHSSPASVCYCTFAVYSVGDALVHVPQRILRHGEATKHHRIKSFPEPLQQAEKLWGMHMSRDLTDLNLWLADRKIMLCWDTHGHSSDVLTSTTGTAQGTVLSPFLFTLFTSAFCLRALWHRQTEVEQDVKKSKDCDGQAFSSPLCRAIKSSPATDSTNQGLKVSGWHKSSAFLYRIENMCVEFLTKACRLKCPYMQLSLALEFNDLK